MSKKVLFDTDCDYSILTHVNLGRRMSDVPSGWALNLWDIREFIPVLRYEKECYIILRNIIAPCKIVINPRLFYKGKLLKEHLRNMKKIDENRQIPIEIKFNKKELDMVHQKFDSSSLNFIDTDLLVGKSYDSRGWALSKNVVSQLFPLNSYDLMFPVCIDNIPVETRFNIQTRLFYSSKELSDELKRLSKIDSKRRVDARIILNEKYLESIKKLRKTHKSDNKCIVCGNSLDKDCENVKCYDCLDKELTVLKLKKILNFFKPSETFNENDLLELGFTQCQINVIIYKFDKYDLISINWDGSIQFNDGFIINNFINKWG